MLVAMRWVFALLLLANIAFFLTMQLPQGTTGTESMAAHAPHLAEKIRLISEEEAQRQPSLPVAAPAPTRICMEWTLATQDLERAQSALKSLQLDENDIIQNRTSGKTGSYWVYIPPLKSKQEANKKVEELKGLGIQDSFVMQDNNKWRYAVSLGIFSSEEGAAKYLVQMREKGVKSAKIAPRGQEGEHASLIIRADREDLEVELVKVKQNFPDSTLKAVACAS
jgi:hypothetical protein